MFWPWALRPGPLKSFKRQSVEAPGAFSFLSFLGPRAQGVSRTAGEEIKQTLTLLLVVSALGCRSTQTFTCDSSTARAPLNLGVVLGTDGAPLPIFRGGQPDGCANLDFLKSLGVKSILKLNDRESSVDVGEKENAAKLGLRVETFNFNAATIGREGTCDQVRRAIAFLKDPANWPVYVHCTAGKDRTGYIIGIYEKTIGKSTPEVMRELKEYGHRGMRSIVMSQIDRELASDVPTCLQPSSSASLRGSTSEPLPQHSDKSNRP